MPTTIMGQTFIEPPPVASETGPRTALVSGRAAGGKWWLWPHLLSLDAPLVALAWQSWWGRSVHDLPATGQRVCLGLGVWLIYLSDRWADNARRRPGDDATARHGFAWTHRRPLLVLAAVIASFLVGYAPVALPPGQFRGGLVLLAAAGVYFWSIHRKTPARWTRYLPKEAVVGGMFAVGTAFFVWFRPAPPPAPVGIACALLGVACFLNCALITVWEYAPHDRRDPASLLNAFPSLANGGLRTACWGLAAASGVAGWGWNTGMFAPVTLAAGALATLDRMRGRLSLDALRCLVDLALLTPGICLGVAVVFRWVAAFSST